MQIVIGYVNIGIIFYCIGNSQWCIQNTEVEIWLVDIWKLWDDDFEHALLDDEIFFTKQFFS